ncbi:ATP-binding protein [Diaphorobacter sp. HDW4A]|uniref:sensor histidine kinase n=1 Tax=Diaphorobacter sp. HDW4A TaxID=2714924 RepID=UPI001F0E1C7C|nr:ATP-binding protein [Diaphorobacter sp. HDW4A]
MTRWLRHWLVLCLMVLAGSMVPAWAAESASNTCKPRVLNVEVAQAAGDGSVRPTQGWVSSKVPDAMNRRWPGYDGSAWYRIDFDASGCSVPVALGIDGIGVAGAVFINDDLLWRDSSLVEPLSRSWNVPRWWVLPASSLHAGVNSVWVHVVGLSAIWSGVGALRLGDEATVRAQFEHAQWHQRTIYSINAVLCGMAGLLFVLVWLLRRKEPAYGWFALMSLAWLAYLSTYLAASPWPFADSIMRSRASMVALIAYVFGACLFTFRYGGQRLPKVESALWVLATVGSAASLLAPRADAAAWWNVIWQGAMAVFLLNARQFQWHVWRGPRERPRRRSDMLLALVWLVFVVVALHDLSGMLGFWEVARNWAALSGPLIIALIMLVLGTQLVQEIRGVERFNRALADGIANARTELTQAQEREHAQALQNATLQERVRIAHDLHDGLGASLVRGMALVEQASEPLPNGRVLSILKTLRDDLRQMIDYNASGGADAAIPDTPVQWAAPLRHRFTRIFDELEVDSTWNVATQWLDPELRPSALQSLNLSRLVEEALSNVIKHSRATSVRVRCEQPSVEGFVVCVEDNGVGFDVAAVQQQHTSVGMRSMTARTARIGGRLSVDSGACGTLVSVEIALSRSTLAKSA